MESRAMKINVKSCQATIFGVGMNRHRVTKVALPLAKWKQALAGTPDRV